MSVLASSNIVTSRLLKYLSEASQEVERIQKRLSSGERDDDAVRIGIADSLDAQQITGLTAIENLNDGISYLNIAESALTGVKDLMTQVRSLLDEASATSDPSERTALNTEANALIEQVNEIISTSSYGDRLVFFGESPTLTLKAGQGDSGSFQVTVGDGASLLYSSIDITTTGDPASELTGVDSYLEDIELRLSDINAGRSRAAAATSYLGVMVGVYEEASLSMRSIDETEEIAALEEASAQQDAVSGLLLQQLDSKSILISQIYDTVRQWRA